MLRLLYPCCRIPLAGDLNCLRIAALGIFFFGLFHLGYELVEKAQETQSECGTRSP